MQEKTLSVDIPLLLPGIPSRDDGCLGRLEEALANRKGVLRAHVKRQDDPPSLCLHYDPARLSLLDVRRMAEQVGAALANQYRHEVMPIEGMDCSDCALVVEHALGRAEGVLSASVSYAAQTLQVEYDNQRTSRGAIERRIRQLGYEIPAAGPRRWHRTNRPLVVAALAGAMLGAGWMVETFTGLAPLTSLALYAAAYLLAGYEPMRQALLALRQRSLDTDLLMVLAALGALAVGEHAEGALLLFLFNLGHVLENRALDRARRAVRSMTEMMPRSALVRRGGEELDIPLEELALGETVIVRPGARIPVDGEIISGTSAVDQSPVTGESMPVDKGTGDPVFAGSLNGQGLLEVRVTRLARDSTLSRVIRSLEQAKTRKSPTQQVTERLMRPLVPSVLGASLLLVAIPPLLGVPFHQSFLRAMTLLVAASPCALALATPSAVLSGIARAARAGVLVKGGVHLETLGKVQAIAFDKTGTLTVGRSGVTEVVPVGAHSEAEVLAFAAAAESRSVHPLGKAIVREAVARGIKFYPAESLMETSGVGVVASVDGVPVSVSRHDASRGTLVPELDRVAGALESQSKTTVLVARAGTLVGVIALADTVRPEAESAVKSLKSLGLRRTAMLTGDNRPVAEAMAKRLGIDDVLANLSPQDKARTVRDLVARFGTVAMVGDGVNDAPALALASVGIAIGSAGNDVALEAADVALMTEDLERLPFTVALGQGTLDVIRQNLVVAIGTMLTLMVSTVVGWAGIGSTILFHEGSTLLVVLNALRLLRFRHGSVR